MVRDKWEIKVNLEQVNAKVLFLLNEKRVIWERRNNAEKEETAWVKAWLRWMGSRMRWRVRRKVRRKKAEKQWGWLFHLRCRCRGESNTSSPTPHTGHGAGIVSEPVGGTCRTALATRR